MKKCGYSQSDLLSYLQNRMSCEQENEFQKHLISCPECRQELERLRSVIRALANKQHSPKTWLIASAVACSVLIGFCIYQNQTEESLPPAHQFHINSQPRHQDIDTLKYDSTKVVRDSIK